MQIWLSKLPSNSSEHPETGRGEAQGEAQQEVLCKIISLSWWEAGCWRLWKNSDILDFLHLTNALAVEGILQLNCC